MQYYALYKRRYKVLKIKDPKGSIFKPEYKRYTLWAKVVALLLALAVILNCYIYLNSHFAKIIAGASMCPNLNSTETGQYSGQKDIVLVNKFTKPSYKDIVIINTKGLVTFDAQNTKLIVKRIVAVGGDKLKIIHNEETNKNEVWRNGVKIEEDYINPDTDKYVVETFNKQTNWYIKCPRDSDGYITIPLGYYFFMGDNRNNSLDSRYVGPLDQIRMLGVVDKIIYDNTIWHDIIATLLQFNLNF